MSSKSKKTVNVRLTNRYAYLEQPYDKETLQREWSYSVSIPRYIIQRRWPGWDGRKKLLVRDRVPAGLFRATRKEIEEKYDLRFRVTTRRESLELERGLTSNRGYQNDCIDRMLESITAGGGLVLNATGSGKTRIAAIFASRITGRICFVVDQLDLLVQAKKELESTLGEKIGYVGNQIFDPRRITVATVQTLARHRRDKRFLPWTESLDVVIIDEIHVQMNRSNFNVVADIEPKAVFGLTATLQLKKKPVRLRAWSLAGPVLYEYPVKQGMKEKVLSQGVVVRILYPNPIEDEGTPYRSKAQQEYLSYIVENPERNSIISRLARYGVKHGKKGIILVERIKHLQKLSKRLKDVKHSVVYGAREVEDRYKDRDKFEREELPLILANKVFKKGVDIKRVDMIIDGAGMQSKDDALQKFGRGLRLHKKKAGLLYFDISDIDPEADRKRKEAVEAARHKIKKAKNKKERSKAKRKLAIAKKIGNRFAKAAKRRKKAFVQAGIKVLDIVWNEAMEPRIIMTKAENALKKELDRK